MEVNYEGLAGLICTILRENYPSLRHDGRFTPWGVSFYWDEFRNSLVSEPIESNLGLVIPRVLNRASELGLELKVPELYVPKANDPVLHYSLMAMRNRSVITSGLLSLAGINDGETERILDDSRLTEEAASEYISLRRSREIPENSDFLNFMLHFRSGESYAETNKPNGQFRNLLERMMVSHERTKDLFSSIISIVPEEMHTALKDLHVKSLAAREPSLDKALEEAYRSCAKQYGRQTDEIPRTIRTKLPVRVLLGPRRVNISRGSGGEFIDWEVYSARLGESSSVNLNPNVIVMQQIVNLMTPHYTSLYASSPSVALAQLENDEKQEENPVKKIALNRVLCLLKDIHRLSESPRINHRMTINKAE